MKNIIRALKIFFRKLLIAIKTKKALRPGKKYRITFWGNYPGIRLCQFKNGKWDDGIHVKSGDEIFISDETLGAMLLAHSDGQIDDLEITKIPAEGARG